MSPAAAATAIAQRRADSAAPKGGNVHIPSGEGICTCVVQYISMVLYNDFLGQIVPIGLLNSGHVVLVSLHVLHAPTYSLHCANTLSRGYTAVCCMHSPILIFFNTVSPFFNHVHNRGFWVDGLLNEFNRLPHHTPGPGGIASLDPQTVLQY
eukprot:COSAG05_NODE_2197_length_3410_cov_7.529447_5_plen_151_part_01